MSAGNMQSARIRTYSGLERPGEIHLKVGVIKKPRFHHAVRYINGEQWETLTTFTVGTYDLVKKMDEKTKQYNFCLILRPMGD